MQFDKKLSQKDLAQALINQRNSEIERLIIEPFYLIKVPQNPNHFLIVPPQQNWRQVYNALKKASQQKLFTLAWEVRTLLNKALVSTVNIIEHQQYFYIKSKRDLRASETFFYSIVSTNVSLKRALQNLTNRTMNEQFEEYLFGKKDKIDVEIIPFKDSQFPNEINLNESQKQAIRNAMKYPLTAIQGPPGTGKTRCILALAMIFLRKGMKVMICTPSNPSLLMITRLLMEYKFDPKRTLFLLSKIAGQNFETTDLNSIDYYLRSNQIAKQQFTDPQKLQNFYAQQQLLMNSRDITDSFFWKDLGYIRSVLMHPVHLLCCTVLSSGKAALRDFKPDVTIIDEAGQASETETIVAMNKGSKRVILIGDQSQLLPVCMSQNPELQKTLLGRIWTKSPELTSFLNVQYRMHPDIANFTNKVFYDNKIINGVTAENRSSNILLFKQHPLLIVHHKERESQYMKSYYSHHEIHLIAQILKHFPHSQLRNVGIITPFKPQLAVLEIQFQHLMKKGLEIKVLDGYQGNEKDYIIISFVRSNPSRHVGYLSLMNRTNVALTRARKGMVVVGNLQTMKSQINGNPWNQLVEYCQKELRDSVLEESKFLQLIKDQPEFCHDLIQKDFVFNLGSLKIEQEEFDVEATEEKNLNEKKKEKEQVFQSPQKQFQQEQLPSLSEANSTQPWWQKMNEPSNKPSPVVPEVLPPVQQQKKQEQTQSKQQPKRKKKKEVIQIDISQNLIKW